MFFLAAVIATAFIAELSFRFIEWPLLRLKIRFGGMDVIGGSGRITVSLRRFLGATGTRRRTDLSQTG